MVYGRPQKKRVVSKKPETFKFSPRGRRGRPDTVILRMEEFEAIRLSDYEALTHLAAAEKMGVSRQTFERILKKARSTISDAVVNGKIIKIWGGAFEFSKEPLEE